MSNKPAFILYAEDDEEDRFVFMEGVRRANAQVCIVAAENGQDVINYLTAIEPGGVLPLAIVSDLRMPLCDGLDMLRIVKQELRWKTIPVILFSTSSSCADKASATQLGAAAFFTKPDTHQAFMKAVETILALCRDYRYARQSYLR